VRVCVRVYVTYGGAWTHEFTHATASKGLEGVHVCVCVCVCVRAHRHARTRELKYKAFQCSSKSPWKCVWVTEVWCRYLL